MKAHSILEDDATRPADKLKAISQISRLLGLETQQIDMAVSSADDINARAWQAVRARLGLPDRNRNTGELTVMNEPLHELPREEREALWTAELEKLSKNSLLLLAAKANRNG